MDALQRGERAEPAQRHRHRPPFGRAIRAPLSSDVQHLRLAARGEQGPGPCRQCLSAGTTDADLGEDACGHREFRLNAGRESATTAASLARLVLLRDDRADDDADYGQERNSDSAYGDHPAALFGLPLRRLLRGNPRPSGLVSSPVSLAHAEVRPLESRGERPRSAGDSRASLRLLLARESWASYCALAINNVTTNARP